MSVYIKSCLSPYLPPPPFPASVAVSPRPRVPTGFLIFSSSLFRSTTLRPFVPSSLATRAALLARLREKKARFCRGAEVADERVNRSDGESRVCKRVCEWKRHGGWRGIEEEIYEFAVTAKRRLRPTILPHSSECATEQRCKT